MSAAIPPIFYASGTLHKLSMATAAPLKSLRINEAGTAWEMHDYATDLDAKEDVANKDQPDGYAGLDGEGNLSVSAIVPYADTAANIAGQVGVPNEIKVTTDTQELLLMDGVTSGGKKIGDSVFKSVGTNSAQLAGGGTSTSDNSLQVGGSIETNVQTSSVDAIQGGYDNLQDGSIAGFQIGHENEQSGPDFFQGGSRNVQYGTYTGASIQSGDDNYQSQSYSLQVGSGNTQAEGEINYAGTASIQGGLSNVQGSFCGLQSGCYGNDFDLHAARCHAAGSFTSTAGTAQFLELIARRQTTNATVTELLLDEDYARAVLQNDSTYFFTVKVAARRTDADGESAAYELTGCIDRQTNAASTALVGSVTKTSWEDNAAWDVSASADTTNGALKIEVTGETSKTIRWVARIELVQVTG